MVKPHPLPCPHVFNNAHPGSWRVRAEFWPRHTYIQTYAQIKIYIKCVCGPNSLGPSLIQNFFFLALFALHTNEIRCNQEGFHPCYSQSQIVYAYHVLNLSLQGIVGQSTFFGFFFWAWHEHRNGCGHTHVLKTFLRLYGFQIYGHMGLIP